MIRLTVKFNLRPFQAWCTSRVEALRRWGQGEIQAGPAMLTALERYHAGLFASGAAGSGYGPWAALKARTLRARTYRTRCSRIAPNDYLGGPGGNRILVWSTRLMTSLTTQGNSYGDAIRKAGPTSITYGTSTPTALFHAAGRGGRNRMPVRMPVDDRFGPTVAIDAAEVRILSYLMSDKDRPVPSPTLAINAAGFYSNR